MLVSVAGLALPVVGQIAGGLLGGFLSGWLVGGTGRGAWHGLLAGLLGGLILAVFVAVASTLLGLTGVVDPVTALLGGGGVSRAVVFLGFLFALDSALGGALGGAVRT